MQFQSSGNSGSGQRRKGRSVCGSMPCGCARESRCRRWLSRMRAWKEECDVCSSLPQSLSAESEFDTGVKGGSPRKKNMMIGLVRMLHGVHVMRTSYVCFSRTYVQRAGTRSDLRTEVRESITGGYLYCSVFFDQEDVRQSTRYARTHDKVNIRNVQDGMWRWTCSTDVVCSALATWLQQGCAPCNEVTSVIFLSQDTGFCEFLWWTIWICLAMRQWTRSEGLVIGSSVDWPWIPSYASQFY